MVDHFNENVNQLLNKSLSEMKLSLKHLTKSTEILEKAMKEQECFNRDDIRLAEWEMDSQGQSISELRKLMERKRKSFRILK